MSDATEPAEPIAADAPTHLGFTNYAEWRCPVCNAAEYGRTPSMLRGQRWVWRFCNADRSHTPEPFHKIMGSVVMLDPPLPTWAAVEAFVFAKAEAAGDPKPRLFIYR